MPGATRRMDTSEQGTVFNGNEAGADAEKRARLLDAFERALRAANLQGAC